MIAAACVAATALCVAALLLAEWRGHRLGVWVAKPLASLGFVLLALALGAAETGYGRLVLLALCLSLLGDVLLVPRGARAAFVLGLLAFLAGHVAYAAAFASRERAGLGVAAALAVPAVIAIAAWLRPHVEGGMRVAVGAYVLVIATMVVLASGVSVASGRPAFLAGALGFAVSDLAVARERFVAPAPTNALWGLPLYYASQLVLASTVA